LERIRIGDGIESDQRPGGAGTENCGLFGEWIRQPGSGEPGKQSTLKAHLSSIQEPDFLVMSDANGENLTKGALQVVWKTKRNVPKKPSLLLVDDLLFSIDDGGVASCLEAKSGAEVWRERVGGNYSASPLFAAGRIYFFSEEGKTTVIEASRQFKKLAENTLSDGFMASPAVSGGALYLRTRSHLYRIED
jgi:outer membrane protein assembly factor BamB